MLGYLYSWSLINYSHNPINKLHSYNTQHCCGCWALIVSVIWMRRFLTGRDNLINKPLSIKVTCPASEIRNVNALTEGTANLQIGCLCCIK